MGTDIENFFDAFGIVAPKILEKPRYRRHLARIIMTIHMMKADNVVKPAETVFLKRMIEMKFSLDEVTSRNLAEELCEDSEHQPNLDALVAYIKEHSTPIERADCVREMWEVAVCDLEVHPLENDFAFRCADLLELDASEMTWLQEVVEETLVDEKSTLVRVS